MIQLVWVNLRLCNVKGTHFPWILLKWAVRLMRSWANRHGFASSGIIEVSLGKSSGNGTDETEFLPLSAKIFLCTAITDEE